VKAAHGVSGVGYMKSGPKRSEGCHPTRGRADDECATTARRIVFQTLAFFFTFQAGVPGERSSDTSLRHQILAHRTHRGTRDAGLLYAVTARVLGFDS
jgi:hypothetical protein